MTTLKKMFTTGLHLSETKSLTQTNKQMNPILNASFQCSPPVYISGKNNISNINTKETMQMKITCNKHYNDYNETMQIMMIMMTGTA